MQRAVIQSILNVADGKFGLRYLKLVKSPGGPHFIVDVMFRTGFRITADILPGDPVQNIGRELERKTELYRSSSFDELKPSIDFVAECMGRVLADEHGRVAEGNLQEDAIRQAWESALLHRYLKVIDPRRRLEFELAVEDLKSLYPAV